MRIRTSISKKNPYWVPKHRFLELYHFSLQYKDWVKELTDTIYIPSDPEFDPTGNIAARIARLKTNCELVKRCCADADSALQKFIFIGVTEGYSYDTLRTKFHIPCGKDYYYLRYRKYFWLLSVRK